MKKIISVMVLTILVCSFAFPQKTKIGGTLKVGGKIPRVGQEVIPCSFPCTGLLDQFNRADGGLGSDWSSPITVGSDTHTISINEMLGNTSHESSYWITNTFGPNVEVRITAISNSGGFAQLIFGANNLGTGSLTGYAISLEGNQLQLYRIDSGTFNSVGAAISQTFTSGDSFGAYRNATNGDIDIYYEVGIGSWNNIGTRNDSTYTATGSVGVRSGAAQFDNFGGGTR